MPRIPVYTQETVQVAPIPSSRMNVPTPTAPIQNAGLSQGLASLASVAMKAQDEADSMRAEEAFNRLREAQNQLGYGDGKDEKGAFNVKAGNVFNRGEDAPAFKDEYMTKFDERAQAIFDGLSNNSQKTKFFQIAGRARTEFDGALSRHEAQQGEAYRESVYKGVLEIEREHIAQNFKDPDSVAQSIERVKANTKMYASGQGLAADQQEMAVKEAVSGMHMMVLSRMLQGDSTKGIAADPTGAKAYYQEQVKLGAIAESTEAAGKMRGLIETGEREVRAISSVDKLWAEMGPKGDTASVNLDRMDAKLRAEYGTDTDGLKVARAELKERASQFDYSVRQRESSTSGDIFKQVLDGKSLSEIRKSPAFRGLDGAKQISMISTIENYNNRNGEGDAMDKYAKYWAVSSNPVKLNTMTDAEIFAMTPQIGGNLVKQLLKEKQTLGKSEDKVIDATVDADMFGALLRQAGLEDKPKAGSKDDDIKGDIKYRAEKIIDAEQRANGGKPLTRDRKEQIVKSLLVEVPVRYKGTGLFNSGNDYIENKRVFEVQNPENIVVPDAERATIVKTLQEAGIKNPTAAQIRQGYIRLKAN